MAESGTLQALHVKCTDIDAKVESEFMRAKDQIGRIVQQIEEKELVVIGHLQALGIEKLRDDKEHDFFDILGL